MSINDRRRRFVQVSGLGLLGVSAGKVALAALQKTPAQTAGPFYPRELPLDSDNNLLQIEGRAGSAGGTPTNVIGRVLAEDGSAVPGTTVEIWQCDANGRYHHPADRARAPVDENFQGFGKTVTDGDGRYRFRTIRPVPYPGRTPHIHFRIHGPGLEPLTTQLYVQGDPGNAGDGIYSRLARPEAVTTEFGPDPDEPDVLLARWNIVLTRV